MKTSFFTVRGVPEDVKAEFKLTCLKRRETAGQVVTGLMADYVAQSGFETKLWKGFERVRWAELKEQREVWIAGMAGVTPAVYGPHRVIDVDKRVLQNSMGTNFLQYPDILLRRRP